MIPLAFAPTATYRLQLGPDCDFDAARKLLPYLDALGVSHLYLSPIMAAQPGSAACYDVVDPTRVSDELGGDAALLRLADAAHDRGLGLIVDFVSNHLAATCANPWWRDVLTLGRDSPHARVFDVDWDADVPAPGEPPKLVLPVLGAPLHEVLARGELTCDGACLRYWEHTFPLAPGTAPGEPVPADAIPALLARQRYRLLYWRVAGERINYRRFFDINHLVGVRNEDRAVFDQVHRRLLELAAAGVLDGVRVDHVDGLRDPAGYLAWLRAALPSRCYLVVEKILAHGEVLPDWPVDGTTGYEFARALAGVFVDRDGYTELAADYDRFLGYALPFDARLVAQKRRVLNDLFGAEVDRLAHALTGLAGADVAARDLPPSALRAALCDVTVCLPVYRTYARAGALPAHGAKHVAHALAGAHRHARNGQNDAIDFLGRVLRADIAVSAPGALRRATAAWVERWQQLTGAVMAKGLEDTALYQDFRLISLNTVGGEPEPDPSELAVAAFHAHNRAQLAAWPTTMTATATHDSKRGEDVRARIHGLADLGRGWSRALHRWHRLTAPHRRHLDRCGVVPSRNVEVLIFQTLLGVWPAGAPRASDELRGRLCAYFVKAVREAKLHTSWLDPDPAYEDALCDYLGAILSDAAFVADFLRLQRRVAAAGAITSLAQVLLKIAAPGVPDIYQGSELWSLTLVDPDNRGPVDFAARRALIAAPDEPAGVLLGHWRDGRVKLHVTRRALHLRRAHRELFLAGSYHPLRATGAHADLVCAFERANRYDRAICVVPRRAARLMADGTPPVGRRTWRDTTLHVTAGTWRDVLTGRDLYAPTGELLLGDLFAELPVAFLLHCTMNHRATDQEARYLARQAT